MRLLRSWPVRLIIILGLATVASTISWDIQQDALADLFTVLGQ